jgi:hypothetical protein
MKVSEALEKLKEDGPDEHIAMAIWTTHDVFDHAMRNEKRVTQEKANEIIDEVDMGQEAEYGITWDNLYDGIIRKGEDIPDVCMVNGNIRCDGTDACQHSFFTCLAENKTFEEKE